MRPRPGGFSRSAKRSIWLAEVRGPSRRATWASVFSSGPVRTSTRTRPDARAAVPKRRAGARRRGPAAAARAVWRRARRAHRRADPRAPRTRAGLPTRSVARPAVALPAHGHARPPPATTSSSRFPARRRSRRREVARSRRRSRRPPTPTRARPGSTRPEGMCLTRAWRGRARAATLPSARRTPAA
jgi:hypothetical protein